MSDAGDGTVSWLCGTFLGDASSSLQRARVSTRQFYAGHIEQVVRTAGEARLDGIEPADVGRWQQEWRERHGARDAIACMQTLRRLARHGEVDLQDDRCARLSAVLTSMRAGPRRPSATRVIFVGEGRA